MDGAEARFADGRTARLHRVRARLDGGRLALADADTAEPLADWPLDTLRRIGARGRGDRLVLASGDAPDARLVIEDAALAEALAVIRPDLFGAGRSRPRLVALWAGAVLAGIGATGVLIAFGVPAAAERLVDYVPPSWERRLGETVIGQIRSVFGHLGERGGTCVGGPGVEALAGLAGRLSGALEPRPAIEVRVLDIGMVNAFAAPGGRVVVLRGLIDAAETPDELAGILAHEIGHAYHRHATKALIRSLGAGLLVDLVTGGGAGRLGGAARAVVDLSYGREAEAAADRTGLAALAATGITAKGFVRFFERQARRSPDGRGMATILSTHPPSAQRAALARTAPDGGPGLNDAEWAAVKAVCTQKQ